MATYRLKIEPKTLMSNLMKKAREIYDTFVMRELLSSSGLYTKASAEHVQKLLLAGKPKASQLEQVKLAINIYSLKTGRYVALLNKFVVS